MKKTAPIINTDYLRSRLKLKAIQSGALLKAHHPQAVSSLEAQGLRVKNLRLHAAKVLASGATLASIMLPPTQIMSSVLNHPDTAEISPYTPDEANTKLKSVLPSYLPKQVMPISDESSLHISEQIKTMFGVNSSTELDGNRLNTNYGYMGAEQHLPRFPGDSAEQHDNFQGSGITPGRGAWGYFANSKSELTSDLTEKEKYYFAVQTLYLPDWSTRLAYLRDWYKYRKMIAINPVNGKVVVGVVADSGPSWWTGKSFGGSPEIMHYLNLKDGKQKGAVIMLFVDDPNNQVPLGPLEFNLEKTPVLVAS